MRARWHWLLPVGAVPFLGLLLFGLVRDPDFFPTPLTGQPAPDWRLETLEGDTLSLGELSGKVVVLNFWASWCLPCVTEHDVLLRTARGWPDDEVEVVGVVYNDTRRNARRFLDELGDDWRHVLDPGSRTAIDYGVYGPPETFFIGRDGRVGYKHLGPVTWELVRDRVDSLLAVPGGRAAAGRAAAGRTDR